MPPVLAYARVPEVDLLAAYDEHCGRLGLISVNLGSAARTFLRRWPDPQRWAGEPLETRLTVSHPTRSFVTFLMLAGYLRPGYDYLIRRKLAVFWRHLPPGPLAEDLARFLGAAQELGFTERTRSAAASQVIGRLLIQTGRRLDALIDNDFDDLLAAASAARHGAGKASRHYSSATHTAPAGHVSPRCALRAACQRDQPATAELRPADAGRYPGAAGNICGLPRSVDRHPHPRHGHRHRDPAQPLRRTSGRGRPATNKPG